MIDTASVIQSLRVPLEAIWCQKLWRGTQVMCGNNLVERIVIIDRWGRVLGELSGRETIGELYDRVGGRYIINYIRTTTNIGSDEQVYLWPTEGLTLQPEESTTWIEIG